MYVRVRVYHSFSSFLHQFARISHTITSEWGLLYILDKMLSYVLFSCAEKCMQTLSLSQIKDNE